jgi:DNA-binding beta-propeller fold protein YncE
MPKRVAILFSLACACLVLACLKKPGNPIWIISPPAGLEQTKIKRNGNTVIPNGRFITPRGFQIDVAPHPFGLVLSPDGSMAITANCGIEPFSVSIIDNILGQYPSVRQIPPKYETDEGVLASVYMGLAVAPKKKVLYVGGGQEGKIIIFDLATDQRVGAIDANISFQGKTYQDSYVGDLVLSSDGKVLYALDQANFRLLIASTETRKVLSCPRLGRYPFGLALSQDGKRLYAANVGMFEYSRIEGVNIEDPNRQGLLYPPFSYLSKEGREGITKEGYRVPGLGDPNIPESFSVWEIDVRDSENPQVTAQVKTGVLVGELVEGIPAVGGASPNSVAATDDRVFVSNGNNDSISVVDTKKDTVVSTINLTLDPRLGNLRGIIPFGLALSPDKRRLYVAEAGINAIGVIDIPHAKVLGHIPVGWFPSRLAVSKDGKFLIVANAKGFGSGPNGGARFKVGPEGSYIGNLMKGTVSVLPIPKDADLKKETRQVLENNFRFQESTAKEFSWRQDNPIPLFPGEKESPIKHIVYVVKENRTFDEVFGQKKNAAGDADLARYGSNVTFANEDGTKKVEEATVMPNHLALADRFAISDNFYCDSDVSADGHRWLVGVYPNEWVEVNVGPSYGNGRDMKFDSPAPGELGFVGASAAIYPEDYNEAGSIWDHFARHKVEYFNFGLGLQFISPLPDDKRYKYTGTTYVINYPTPAELLEHSSKIYATFNLAVPDQFRVDMFIKNFNERWAGEGKMLPSFLTVYLPNDHGADERPNEGYPFHESYMADNDLALGRLVEFLSRTSYWKNMAIFLTEDDAQSGVDHVDGHRSLLMVISPYAKKDYISHVHTSFGSVIKTCWHILGLPYLNQYDGGAADLADLFTDQPDPEPYTALPADSRIFDPQKALDPLDEKFNWKALMESPGLDDPKVAKKWLPKEPKKGND